MYQAAFGLPLSKLEHNSRRGHFGVFNLPAVYVPLHIVIAELTWFMAA